MPQLSHGLQVSEQHPESYHVAASSTYRQTDHVCVCTVHEKTYTSMHLIANWCVFISLYRTIFKCVMCETVFTNKTILHTHFETHLTNQKVHVFKCPECTKLFSQRNSLLEHFKVHAMCVMCRFKLPFSLEGWRCLTHAFLLLRSIRLPH